MADDAPSTFVCAFDFDAVITTAGNSSAIKLKQNRQEAVETLNAMVRTDLYIADFKQHDQGRRTDRGVFGRIAYDADILSQVSHQAGSQRVTGRLTVVLEGSTLTRAIMSALANQLASQLEGSVKKWIEDQFDLPPGKRDIAVAVKEYIKPPDRDDGSKRFNRWLMSFVIINTLLLVGIVAGLGYVIYLRLF